MIGAIVFGGLLLMFWGFGYWFGRDDGYERGYSDAWWRSRGEPTMSEWDGE